MSDLVSTAGSLAIKRLIETISTPTDGSTDVDPDSKVSSQLFELRHLIQKCQHPSMQSIRPAIITAEDFLVALPRIQPSSRREGFATIPDTTWADIGALRPVREELITAIVEPIRSPEKYKRVGITAPTGVLLWGPPGCGKVISLEFTL